MKAIRSLFALAILLLGVLGSVGATAQEPIDLRDFHKRFEKNDDLKPEDLDIFPAQMKRHLFGRKDLWIKFNLSGFSRRLGGPYYLFAVRREMGLGQPSSAAIVFHRARSVRSPEDWNWRPVFVPVIYRTGKVESADWLPNVQWDDQEKALVTRFCDDALQLAARYRCAKWYYQVHWGTVILSRMETQEERSKKWVTAWENGEWKIDFDK